MVEEKINKLIKYLKKKNYEKFETTYDSLVVYYTKDGVSLPIRLYFDYKNFVSYDTLDVFPTYKNTGKYITYRSNGRTIHKKCGGENIRNLKTKFNRKDFNSAVYKNLIKIQQWLDPSIERILENKRDLENYTKEIKYYYEDKYGKDKIRIRIHGDDVKYVSIEIKLSKDLLLINKIKYQDKKYFLVYESLYNKKEYAYKQRKLKNKSE